MISAALAILTKLPWKYIGIALAVAAVLFGAYRWAYGRGHDSRNDEVAQLTSRAVEVEASVARLRAAVDAQNAAVDALEAEGDKRAAQGADALRRAQDANKRQLGAIAALQWSAKASYAADAPCATSNVLQSAEGL